MQSEGAKSRREFFRSSGGRGLRSQTVDESDMSATYSRQVVMAGTQLQAIKSDDEIEDLSNGVENGENPSVRKKTPRDKSGSPIERGSPLRTKEKFNRLRLQRRSLTDPSDEFETVTTVAQDGEDRKIGHSRSSSSPSLVLSKVKEKIRKKVVKASDWRDSKAMALEKFSAYGSRHRNSEKKRRSLSNVSRDSTGSLKSGTSGEDLSADNQKAGIVCSTRDLEAILGGKSSTSTRGIFDRSVSVDLPSKTKKIQQEKLRKQAVKSSRNRSSSSGNVNENKVDNDGTFPTKCDLVISEKLLLESLLKPQTVKDVEYDDQGETWEIYGADFDPEVLGDAIQRHLNVGESCDEPDENIDNNENNIRRGNKPNRARKTWFRVFDNVRQKHRKANTTC